MLCKIVTHINKGCCWCLCYGNYCLFAHWVFVVCTYACTLFLSLSHTHTHTLPLSLSLSHTLSLSLSHTLSLSLSLSQITVCFIEICIRFCSRKETTPPPKLPRKQDEKPKHSPPPQEPVGGASEATEHTDEPGEEGKHSLGCPKI